MNEADFRTELERRDRIIKLMESALRECISLPGCFAMVSEGGSATKRRLQAINELIEDTLKQAELIKKA